MWACLILKGGTCKAEGWTWKYCSHSCWSYWTVNCHGVKPLGLYLFIFIPILLCFPSFFTYVICTWNIWHVYVYLNFLYITFTYIVCVDVCVNLSTNKFHCKISFCMTVHTFCYSDGMFVIIQRKLLDCHLKIMVFLLCLLKRFQKKNISLLNLNFCGINWLYTV